MDPQRFGLPNARIERWIQGAESAMADVDGDTMQNESWAAALYEMLASNQRLANCLNSYDFAARRVLRDRAEKGELRIDIWCRWMDALKDTPSPAPR